LKLLIGGLGMYAGSAVVMGAIAIAPRLPPSLRRAPIRGPKVT
jgi:hypothetical protein